MSENPDLTDGNRVIVKNATRRVLISAIFFLIIVACLYLVLIATADRKPLVGLPAFVSSPSPFSISDSSGMQSSPAPLGSKEKLVLTNDRLLVASGSSLFVADGMNDEKIVDFTSEIIGIYPSFDGKKAAVTYKSEKPQRMFDYYNSKLAVVDISSKKMQEVISSDDESVNYIYWSFDNKYFTFWVNSGGEAFVYDVLKTEPIYSVKGGTVSPIVFVEPGRIAFIENSSLFEADINGENKKEIYKGVLAVRPVHEGPIIPNVPFYSKDGRFVVFYNSNADLVIKDKQDGSLTTLGKGEFSDMFRENYPQAYALGYFSNGKLLYEDYKGENYSFDQKAPLFLFDPNTKSISDYPASVGLLGGGVDLSSIFLSSDGTKLVVHSVYTGSGFDVYDEDGNVVKMCDKTGFRYPFYNWGGGPNYANISTVWSLSSRYLISENFNEGLTVVDVSDCKTYLISNGSFSSAVWVRN